MTVTERIAELRRQTEALQREESRLREQQEADVLAAFAASLKRLREAAHLTQEQLADRVGLSRASVANMEAGRQNPPLSLAVLLASALDVSLDELAGAA